MKRPRRLIPSRKKRYLIYQKLAGQYVFIHINKCGGKSIEHVLGIPKIHDTAQQRRAKIGARRWQKAFTFSIVRHPYDKVASHYWFRVKTNQTGLGDRHLDLNSWVRAAYGDRDPRYRDNPLMFAPAVDWLADDHGELMVDYVGYLERIETDWAHIRQQIGVNRDLPIVNQSQNATRAPQDLDQASKEIIEREFAPDFRQFGYRPK